MLHHKRVKRRGTSGCSCCDSAALIPAWLQINSGLLRQKGEVCCCGLCIGCAASWVFTCCSAPAWGTGTSLAPTPGVLTASQGAAS